MCALRRKDIACGHVNLRSYSSAAIRTTRQEPALCTSAPVVGVSNSSSESAIAAALMAHGQRDAQLDGGNRGVGQALEIGDLEMSSLISAMSAASTAISLPMLPIATPTSRRFECGRIVDPIADHAHGVPIRLQLFQSRTFSAGSSPACTAVIPACAAKCAAVCGLSPVSSTRHLHRAIPRRRETISRAAGRSTSDRADHADALPAPRDPGWMLLPAARSGSSCARMGAPM